MGPSSWFLDEGTLYVTPEYAIQLVRECMMMMFWLSAPFLIAGFVTGIVMSLIQIVTSIQDAAFSTVPRLAVFLVVATISMPWVLQRAMTYATAILGDLSRYAR
jgi:flagellar biosynthesis protein FliQ